MGLSSKLAGLPGPRRMDEGGTTGTTYTPQQIIDMITRSAIENGIPEQYWWIPIAVAYGESGLNPSAVGDGGKSVGIYMLHENGAGAGMGDKRYDAQTNIDHQMPEFAQAIKDQIRAQGLTNIDPQKLLQDVWRQVERPSEGALSANTPRTFRWATENLFGGASPNQFGGFTIGVDNTGGTGSTGGGDVNLDPTDPNSPLYDPTAAAQTSYYEAQAAYLASQTGVDAAKLAETIRQFNLTWEQENKLKGSQANYYDALSKNLADQFGLDQDKFKESIRQFDLSLAQSKNETLGTLTSQLLQSRLADRQVAGQQQVDLFKTVLPNAVDEGGKVAGALGRMLAGVNAGGAFPTATQNVRLSLTNPADMDAETAAAELAARRILGLEEQPAQMAEGGMVPPPPGGMMPPMDGGQTPGAVDPQGNPLPAGTPNPDDPALVADGQGNWVPAQGAGMGVTPPPGAAGGPAPGAQAGGLAALLSGMSGGSAMPRRAAEGATTDQSLQDMILTYLQGLDPTLKALTTGVGAIQSLGELFGGVPSSLVDQLLATVLPEGTTSGLGGQTQRAKEWEQDYSLRLQELGVSKQQADNQAAAIAQQAAANQLDNETRLKIAGIQDATDRIRIATQSGDTRYAADVAAGAQKYAADLNYKLGLGQLQLGTQQLEETRQEHLANLLANPRDTFEAVAYQAQQKPTEFQSMLDKYVKPNFNAPAGPSPVEVAQSGLAPADNPLAGMAEGGRAHGIEVLVVGDKGNEGDRTRGTEEYVMAPPGTIVADAPAGEEMTMENAVRHIVEQVMESAGQHAAGGYPSAGKARRMLHEGTANGRPLTEKQRGLFGLLASGETPRRAAGGTFVPVPPPPMPAPPPPSNLTPAQKSHWAWVDAQYAQNTAWAQSQKNFGFMTASDYLAREYPGSIPQQTIGTPYPAPGGGGATTTTGTGPTIGASGVAPGVGAVGATSRPPTRGTQPTDPNRTYGEGVPDEWFKVSGVWYTAPGKRATTAQLRNAGLLGPRPAPAQGGGGGGTGDGTSGDTGGGGGDGTGTGGDAGGGAPGGDLTSENLGNLAIESSGGPLAKQAQTTSLYDVLGPASEAYKRWARDTFGESGLPTLYEYNRYSPTQAGVYASMASANKLNPDDLLNRIVRDYAGFNPSRKAGEMASVSLLN